MRASPLPAARALRWPSRTARALRSPAASSPPARAAPAPLAPSRACRRGRRDDGRRRRAARARGATCTARRGRARMGCAPGRPAVRASGLRAAVRCARGGRGSCRRTRGSAVRSGWPGLCLCGWPVRTGRRATSRPTQCVSNAPLPCWLWLIFCGLEFTRALSDDKITLTIAHARKQTDTYR